MGYEHIDVELHQFGCEFGEALVPVLGPPIVDDNVLALLVSEPAKARSQAVNSAPSLRERCRAEEADPVSFPAWLRPRRERPRSRRAAEQRDELAAFHSITSSASCCR
jgi:hypothetical protein